MSLERERQVSRWLVENRRTTLLDDERAEAFARLDSALADGVIQLVNGAATVKVGADEPRMLVAGEEMTFTVAGCRNAAGDWLYRDGDQRERRAQSLS